MDPDARDACLNAEKQNTMVHQNEGEMEFYYIWDVIDENYALFEERLKESEYDVVLIGVFLILDYLAVVFGFLKSLKPLTKQLRNWREKQLQQKEDWINHLNN